MSDEHRFNFVQRRAERAKEKQEADEKEKQRLEKLEAIAELLKVKISQSFSPAEIKATREGHTVKIVRMGAGRSATIEVKDDDAFVIKKDDGDFGFSVDGEKVSSGTILKEKAMVDWIEDWSKA